MNEKGAPEAPLCIARRTILAFAILFTASFVGAAPHPGAGLAAVYRVDPAVDAGGTAAPVILWRLGNRLAVQYPDRHETLIWSQPLSGRVSLSRHFDTHKRAIEYAPGELSPQSLQYWQPLLAMISGETAAGKLRLSSGDTQRDWILERVIEDEAEVRKMFRQWDDYETTDYADIGDNESDPFLMRMINMGFLHGHQH